MNRRYFLTTLGIASIGAVIAPRIFSESPTDNYFTQEDVGQRLDIPILHGDGIHCDADALEAWTNGQPVVDLNRHLCGNALIGGHYRLTRDWKIGAGLYNVACGATFIYEGGSMIRGV